MTAEAEAEVGAAKGGSRLATPVGLLITGALLASVLVYQGHHAWIAFDRNDTNHLETPLLLATARQLADGPSTLYGPFSGSNPLVLIHAPLYYRVAALIAWPMTRADVDPLLAALIAARGLAFAGFLLTIGSAFWMARTDGASGLAGAWAALLVAGSPVFGSFGFTVRPDTLGIGFQTLGFACVWRGLTRDEDAPAMGFLFLGGVLLGLAACAKQHLLLAWGVCGLLLVLRPFSGRIRRLGTVMTWVVFYPSLVVLTYYAFESWATGGEMANSVFRLPARLRQAAPASWEHVATVFFEVAKLAAGAIALAVAVVLCRPRAWIGARLDAALWLVFVAEVAAMVPLCLGSRGAWVNYAMPAAVWGSILLARAMHRALLDPGSGRRIFWFAPAALAFFAADLRLAAISYSLRRDDAALIGQVLADSDVALVPASARYFVRMPQGNRLHGRSALAHDEWLYGSYEALGMAEPRRAWLRAALTGDGPVRVVIAPSDAAEGGDHVPGLEERLPALGYRVAGQYGRYGVWVRDPSRP